MVERNWAGNIEYRSSVVHRPASLDELRNVVLGERRLRALGTRHSFNEIADGDALVHLGAMPDDIVVDVAGRTVELNSAVTYGRLAEALHPHGLALHNLASLPHISVGGAIATATHGSGERLGNLATIVSAVDVLRADGETVHLERGDADFDGAVVGLGALGVVWRVRLDVEQTYDVAQHVFTGLPWDAAIDRFDDLQALGDSVSMFTTWGADVDQLWVKRRTSTLRPPLTADDVFGAQPATADLHPISGTSAEHCTPQLGVPGRWSDRLPHFRMGFTPSSGDELQSELLLPRGGAADVICEMRALGPAMAPHLLVSEIRTVAADRLWMSPQCDRPTVAIHCTWRPHGPEVRALVGRIEAALAPFEPRPHWGKLFAMGHREIEARTPRLADFLELVERYDPAGRFMLPWLRQVLTG